MSNITITQNKPKQKQLQIVNQAGNLFDLNSATL